MRSVLIVATCVALGAVACAALVGVDAVHYRLEDGGGVEDEGAPDVQANDAQSDAPRPATSCDTSDAGPAMINAGTFCIDSTEVTQAQYLAFLSGSDGGQQPPECAWNTSYVPSCSLFHPGTTPDDPITGIDWCDALAFCRWTKRRLCGSTIGIGLALPYVKENGEWYAACTNRIDGQHAHPYGNTYRPGACNGIDADAGVPLAAGSFPECDGGLPGLMNMVGNAWEWIDDCTPPDTGPDAAGRSCVLVGGSCTDDLTSGCSTAATDEQTHTGCNIGFRCCADPR